MSIIQKNKKKGPTTWPLKLLVANSN